MMTAVTTTIISFPSKIDKIDKRRYPRFLLWKKNEIAQAGRLGFMHLMSMLVLESLSAKQLMTSQNKQEVSRSRRDIWLTVRCVGRCSKFHCLYKEHSNVRGISGYTNPLYFIRLETKVLIYLDKLTKSIQIEPQCFSGYLVANLAG